MLRLRKKRIRRKLRKLKREDKKKLRRQMQTRNKYELKRVSLKNHKMNSKYLRTFGNQIYTR